MTFFPLFMNVIIFYNTQKFSICIVKLFSYMLVLSRDSIVNLITIMGALHSACMFLGVSNASSVQPVVSIERTVFYREKAAGMYSPLAYAAAQAVVEVPYIAVQTLTYGIITYFMIGFERTLSMFRIIHPKLNSYK